MNILNLPGWVVVGVKENAHDYRIEAAYTVMPATCPHCPPDLFPKLYRHGSWPQVVMDLPVHGKRVGIAVKRPRFRCQNCERTFLQPLPDVDDRRNMTKRLLSHVEQQSLRRPFTAVAADVGVDEKTVRNIFTDFVTYLDEHVTFETPTVMGLDEVHLLRKPRLIVTNIQHRTIIGVMEDRNKRTLNGYLLRLPDKGAVQVVTMDMWKAYRDAAKSYLSEAAVVVDKFHVVRMANQVVDVVRKGLREGLSERERKKYMHSRFLLHRRPKDLDEDRKALLDAWLERYPALADAYRLKEAFYAVYDCDGPKQAWEAFRAWEDSMSREMKTRYKPLLTAMYNWKPEILAYFDHKFTNACTEALNGLAKNVNRLGRGYSFKAIRGKLLYEARHQKKPKYQRHNFEVQEYPLTPPQPGFERYQEWTGRPLLGTDIVSLLGELDAATVLEANGHGRHRPTGAAPRNTEEE